MKVIGKVKKRKGKGKGGKEDRKVDDRGKK